MERIHAQTFASDVDAPRAARAALASLELPRQGEVQETAELLLSELVTNSVRHARGPERDGIELDVLREDGILRIEVTDGGDGFEPRPRTGDPLGASGWGLTFVEELADRWGVRTGPRTCVWFELRLPETG